MASQQRRRGQTVLVYKSKQITDARGDKVQIVDMTAPYEVTVVMIPQRSSRAELPGQQDLDVTRMIVDADLDGVDSWSRVLWNGVMWDVVVPPAYHHGSKHVRHWSMDIRRRPS